MNEYKQTLTNALKDFAKEIASYQEVGLEHDHDENCGECPLNRKDD